LTLGAGQITADKINGGTFDASNNYSFSGSTIVDLGSVTTVDINGGTIDGTIIGSVERSDASFNNLYVHTVEPSGTGTDLVIDTNNKIIKFSSDKRLKTNILSLNSGLDRINKLNPVSYIWKSNDKEDIGFIAQEIKEILPVASIGDDSKEGEFMSYNHRPILATAVKAIQELSQENIDLKDEIKNLKEENNSIKDQLNNITSKLKSLGIL